MVCFCKCCADCLLKPTFSFLIQASVSCTWTNDTQRILLEHFDVILNSPSHLYHSALPFTPSSSWLHEYYSTEFLQEAKVVKGLPAEWGVCSRTVLLDEYPHTFSYWNNIIAVGSTHGIIILDATTGSQIAILSGHAEPVFSLAFSSDGTLLVSGSYDGIIKLWDMQTGGVVKTFCGYTEPVYSISISVDHTTIVSGHGSEAIRLWNIQSGECYCTIRQHKWVHCVSFFPTDPQHFMSASGGTTQQWDIDGHQLGPMYDGNQIAFSPDGTLFLLHGEVVTVQGVSSGVVIAKFDAACSYFHPCCFSPNNRLVAVAADYNVCVWDITGPNPHLVETFIGHTSSITSLAFSSPSILISASLDKSVKFWKISASFTDPVVIDQKSTVLQAENGITIPAGLEGVVGTWGISAGHCKKPFKTVAKNSCQGNTQPINDRLIFIWHTNQDEKINIWDAEKGELLCTIDIPKGDIHDLRISGDGSRVFCLYSHYVQACDIWTEKAIGGVGFQDSIEEFLIVGSTLWAKIFPQQDRGWYFGIPGSSPVQHFKSYPGGFHLNSTKWWDTRISGIKDTVTGVVVFQLSRKPAGIQWNGQYLVVYYSKSSEVFVLDLNHVLQ